MADSGVSSYRLNLKDPGVLEYWVETYSEPFGIPDPDKLLMIGWFNGGEVFRSACVWHRENGKVFYFQPGHESYPTFYNKNVQTIITNAVRWAAPVCPKKPLECPWIARLEEK